TGEVLHQNTSWGELNFSLWLSFWVPVSKSLDVLFGYVLTVFGAQKVFCQDLQRVWKLLEAFNGGNVEISVLLAIDIKSLLGVKGVKAFSHTVLHSLLFCTKHSVILTSHCLLTA